jgi:hypothetical protein
MNKYVRVGGKEWCQTGNVIHALNINLFSLFLRSIIGSVSKYFCFYFYRFSKIGK